MIRLEAYWTVLLGLVVWIGAGGSALGALSSDQERCINTLNKDLQKVSTAVGKDAASCLKDHARERLDGTSPDECMLLDRRGKVAKAKSRTLDDEQRRCVAPSAGFGPSDAETVNRAAMDRELALLRSAFGTNLDSTLHTVVSDRTGAICQQSVHKSLTRCREAQLKAFNMCKKIQLNLGANGPEDLVLCLNSDPQRRVEKACGPHPSHPSNSETVDTLRRTLDSRCVNRGVDLAGSFPKCMSDEPAVLHSCLATAARCSTCLSLVEADGLADVVDCDSLDDGAINGSCACGDGRLHGFLGERCDDGNLIDGDGCSSNCEVDRIGELTCKHANQAFCSAGEREGLECEDTLGHSDCPPGPPSARCLMLSNVFINTRLGSPALTLPFDTKTSIDCGLIDPENGEAECACGLAEPAMIPFPPFGVICISPSESECSPGTLDCDGGTPLDAETFSDHNIGACGLGRDPNCGSPGNPDCPGNQDCAQSCSGYCSARGPGWAMQDSFCEGHCQGGINDGDRCTLDRDCPQGSCAGGEPVAHADRCNCNCVQVGGQPSRAGALQCEISVSSVLERAAPCDGKDIDQFNGDICIPGTTEVSFQRLIKAGNVTGQEIVGGPLTGAPTSCEALAAGDASGLELVTTFGFFDSGTGDTVSESTIVCESACGDGVIDPGEECDGQEFCGPDCRALTPDVIGPHLCSLDVEDSAIEFHRRFASPQSIEPLNGAVSIDCGELDPYSGEGACTCNLVSLDPVPLPFTGVACFEPLAGCTSGEIDCNGGRALDLDVVHDHNIGACGLGDDPNCSDSDSCQGNQDCANDCQGYCNTLGAGYAAHSSECEGYCQGGPNDGMRCATEGDCEGGSCAGANPVAHEQRCGCECVQVGGQPSHAGGLTCNLGVRMRIESELPCDGNDVEAVHDRCLPLTSETTAGTILDLDNFASQSLSIGPREGQASVCAVLEESVTTGLILRGVTSMIDTPMGDQLIPLQIQCE